MSEKCGIGVTYLSCYICDINVKINYCFCNFLLKLISFKVHEYIHLFWQATLIKRLYVLYQPTQHKNIHFCIKEYTQHTCICTKTLFCRTNEYQLIFF
jgi:hypothetical protein